MVRPDGHLPDAVAAAVSALSAGPDLPRWVTIDSAPDGGASSRTVRPLSTWRRILSAAGLEILDERESPEPDQEPTAPWLRKRWRLARPFRDHDDSAPRSFLLGKPSQAVRPEDISRAVDTLLGVPPPMAAPAAILDGSTHVVFLVGTYQEFRQYIPVWAQMPRHSFSVIQRVGATWTDGAVRRDAAVGAWLSARGIAVQAVAAVEHVDWSCWPHSRRVFVCGVDSTAYDVHIWNAAVVIAAARHGFATVQLQHGIWPYADLQAPMTLSSDTVLTWSGEFEASLAADVRWPDGSVAPRAVVTGTQFRAVGCPLFDAYTEAAPPRLEDLLGGWVSGYRHRVLAATNLHWSQHSRGALVNPALLDAARRMRDTLFILKPHPTHDVDDDLLQSCPANVIVLDELCCLAAGLDSPRLVRAVDAVAATQSTILLEAALAKKPFVAIDTGNPNQYAHVRLTAPDEVGEAIARVLSSPPDAAGFRDHYFDANLQGSGTRGVLATIATVPMPGPRPSPSKADLALARIAERASSFTAELVAARARIEGLESELARARRREMDLRTRLLLAPQRDRRTRVALYGASTAGRECLRAIRAVDHLEPCAFFDSDAAQWTTVVDALPVLEPTEEAIRSVDVVVISSSSVDAIADRLRRAGAEDRIVLDYRAIMRLAAADSPPQGTASPAAARRSATNAM